MIGRLATVSRPPPAGEAAVALPPLSAGHVASGSEHRELIPHVAVAAAVMNCSVDLRGMRGVDRLEPLRVRAHARGRGARPANAAKEVHTAPGDFVESKPNTSRQGRTPPARQGSSVCGKHRIAIANRLASHPSAEASRSSSQQRFGAAKDDCRS